MLNSENAPADLGTGEYSVGNRRVTEELIAPAAQNDREAMQVEEPSPVNPVVLARQLLRGRMVAAFALAVLLASAAAAIGFLSQKPEYVSVGTIQVSANRQRILYDDQDDARLRLFDAYASAEASYLQSRPVLERALIQPALERIGWTQSPETFNRLRQSLKVDRKVGLISVAVSQESSEPAAIIVNALLDAYEEMHVEMSRRLDSVREQQLSGREQELLGKLEALEARILDVGQEYGLQSIASAHVRKIAEIEEVDQRVAELATTVASREAATSQSEVDTGDVEIKRRVVLDHAMADMLFERTKRAAELAVLESKHAPEHYLIREAKEALKIIDNAIEDRRSQLATLGTTGALTKAGKSGEEESLDVLRALLDRLTLRREEVREEAKVLNGRLVQLDFLEEERDHKRFLLEETRRALEQVKVESQNTLPGTVEVKTRGSIPTQPASDKRKAYAAVGAVGGAGAGFGMIVLLGLAFRVYRYSDELGSLPSAPPLISVLPAVSGSKLASDKALARGVHGIRKIRNELQLASPHRTGGHVIAVTSTRSGSGASTVALALSKSFAEARLPTVIVDADLVESSLSTELDLGSRPGLREALLSDRLNGEVVTTTVDNLSALPAGEADNVTDQSVSRQPLANLMNRLRQQFEAIIVDVGSFDQRLVAPVCAALSDHVVVVVRSGEKAGTVKSVVAELQRIAPAKALLTLNHAKSSDPAAQRFHIR